jgi:hypothetical protein
MKSSSGESANPHDYHTKIGKKLQALNVTNVDDNHLNLYGETLISNTCVESFERLKNLFPSQTYFI